MTFKKVNPKQSFSALEAEISDFWDENNTFQKSIDSRKDGYEFRFYDGPPFATGTPHYGHILAGTIKDVVPRYQTMLGNKVERKFGWDTHGLPIENLVEKKLGISGRDDIENKIGVHAFNEVCRANVFQYTDEWRKIVRKMGRWVDMDDDYKTLDTDFMESVWWVFKTIYDKDLIYEGNRIVPYCPRCETPLSNFEVNQGYEDIQSKTVTVKFRLVDSDKYMLAWTTTPWTLYANLGLAVGPDIDYTEVLDKKSGERYILGKTKLGEYYKSENDYEILKEYKGRDFEGLRYEPLFSDFKTQLDDSIDLGNENYLGKNAYSVVLGDYVTTDAGTGIVHTAPGYGEDDYQVGQKYDLGFVSHIDDAGRVKNLLTHNGEWVFDFNENVITDVKEDWSLIKIGTIQHSYPHCWRCGTPLIYRGISAWYVAVEKFRDQMVANNKKINWVPESIKQGRMGKWLEGARDWNISRNRYWGSRMPVWQSEDKSEEICIGSINELYELNKDFGQIEFRGDKYYYTKHNIEVDLHKHYVDEIKIKNPKTGNTLTRIPEVLDCWFESGSMPYASVHYPFENSDNFKFPADFISEGLDQTRGWFYTLLVLGTALFDETPFLNNITSGIILAEDGKKMSKSLQNYTDPAILIDKYGADAMRFYLMSSPVVEAQDFRFSDTGVEEIVKKAILPLWNTYSFFTTYANIDDFKPDVGNIYYVRHGETDNNKYGIINGGDDDLDLNETGISQAIELGRNIKISSRKFDVIISSPMTRAKHTAEIIKNQIGFEGEIVISEAFREQNYGEFKGMKHSDIMEKYNLKDGVELRKKYRNNSTESLDSFKSRVVEGYKFIEEKYKGKNVLLVAHGGVYRPINGYINNLDDEVAFFGVSGVRNARLYKLPNYHRTNNLNKWIVSELNLLTKNVRESMDNYRINKPPKYIVDFLENLTNWYIRRSRKIFWAPGMSSDKIEAYNTLYDVLVEFTKIIAPYMPFVSEYIYKNLTQNESVHLDMYPESNPGFILNDINIQTRNIQDIISLGFNARSSVNIRVRQPLRYIKTTHSLDDYFIKILSEELNVKSVLEFASGEAPAQICKPNARLIGPKYGKDVKDILKEAKSGNYTLLDNGNVRVLNFELTPDEYELEFIASDNHNPDEIIESGGGEVIALNISLDDDLINEGYARDIMRQIQESRKEAGYNVDDRIFIEIRSSSSVVSKITQDFKDMIEGETLSTLTILDTIDYSKNIILDDNIDSVELRLKR